MGSDEDVSVARCVCMTVFPVLVLAAGGIIIAVARPRYLHSERQSSSSHSHLAPASTSAAKTPLIHWAHEVETLLNLVLKVKFPHC